MATYIGVPSTYIFGKRPTLTISSDQIVYEDKTERKVFPLGTLKEVRGWWATRGGLLIDAKDGMRIIFTCEKKEDVAKVKKELEEFIKRGNEVKEKAKTEWTLAKPARPSGGSSGTGSIVGGAVAGGIVAGPAGAVVGGMVGLNKALKKK